MEDAFDVALDAPQSSDDVCENCGGPINVMCFKGTSACSELCRKALEGE